jgi:hypothetical protein
VLSIKSISKINMSYIKQKPDISESLIPERKKFRSKL